MIGSQPTINFYKIYTQQEHLQPLSAGRERRVADKTSGNLQIGHLLLICWMVNLLPRALGQWLGHLRVLPPSAPPVNDAGVSKSQILWSRRSYSVTGNGVFFYSEVLSPALGELGRSCPGEPLSRPSEEKEIHRFLTKYRLKSIGVRKSTQMRNFKLSRTFFPANSSN